MIEFKLDLDQRILEPSEIFDKPVSQCYIHRLNNRKLITALVARDIAERINFEFGNKKVLEVCCGPGDLANELSALCKGYIVDASDGSKVLIDHAKKVQKWGNFFVANIHDHPNKGKYDLVVCKDSFHHFTSSDESLNELLELAKPGGYVYIHDLVRNCPKENVMKFASTLTDKNQQMRFLRSMNAALTIEEFVSIIDFSKVSYISINYPITFSKESLSFAGADEYDERLREDKFNLSAIYVLRRKL